MLLSPFEWTIAKRYLLPGRGEAFIALVASISIGVVMLSVAMLVIVMSVMNGFRDELLDRVLGLNGHANIRSYAGAMADYDDLAGLAGQVDGVDHVLADIESTYLVFIGSPHTDRHVDELEDDE